MNNKPIIMHLNNSPKFRDHLYPSEPGERRDQPRNVAGADAAGGVVVPHAVLVRGGWL